MGIGKVLDKKGAALLYAIIASFIVILMSGILIELLTDEIRVNKLTEAQLQSRYLAEAGIEQGLLEKNSATGSGTDNKSGTVLYKYTVEISNGIMTVKSDGYLNGKAKYRITCEVEKDKITLWNETPM